MIFRTVPKRVSFETKSGGPKIRASSVSKLCPEIDPELAPAVQRSRLRSSLKTLSQNLSLIVAGLLPRCRVFATSGRVTRYSEVGKTSGRRKLADTCPKCR